MQLVPHHLPSCESDVTWARSAGDDAMPHITESCEGVKTAEQDHETSFKDDNGGG